MELGLQGKKILVTGGRATGVVLDTGEELHAKVVVSTLHPRTAFLEQVGRENLPDDFAADIEHWKTRSGVVKINVALSELPSFTANPAFARYSTTTICRSPSVRRRCSPTLRPRRSTG